ncbi:MAG TPA: hypothetical protein VN790_04355 [Steroidobacteraceae bacterium]|nr:hypothetical protein [Steroidobacteraceae bacterium]
MQRIANDAQMTGRTGRHPESIGAPRVLTGGIAARESPDATRCVGVVKLRHRTRGHATAKSCVGEATDQEHPNDPAPGSRTRNAGVCLAGRWKRGDVAALP